MLFSVSHDFHLPLPPFSAISISSAWNEHGLSLMFQFRWWKRKRITVTLPSWMWLYNLKFNIRLRFDLVGWDGIVFCCCCCWCVVWFVWWKLLFGLHAKKQQSFEMIKRLYFMWFQALTTWYWLCLLIFVIVIVAVFMVGCDVVIRYPFHFRGECQWKWI